MAVAAAWGIPEGMALVDVVCDPARIACARALVPAAEDQRRVLDRVASLAASALGARAGMVTLVTGDVIRIVGMSSALPESVPVDVGPCPFVLGHGAPLAVQDTTRDRIAASLECLSEGGFLAYAGSPVCVDGQLVGTVAVVDDVTHRFSGDDLELLEDLCGAVEHQLTRVELR